MKPSPYLKGNFILFPSVVEDMTWRETWILDSGFLYKKDPVNSVKFTRWFQKQSGCSNAHAWRLRQITSPVDWSWMIRQRNETLRPLHKGRAILPREKCLVTVTVRVSVSLTIFHGWAFFLQLPPEGLVSVLTKLLLVEIWEKLDRNIHSENFQLLS